jgi:hypothetical protein
LYPIIGIMAPQDNSQPTTRGRKAAPAMSPAAPPLDSPHEAKWFVSAALALSFYLHFSSNNFPDPDLFYHFRHAALYADYGPFFADFPWARYSVIARFGADIWYGFHILLIPFVWLGDPTIALRLAGVFVTGAFLLSIYLACRRMAIKGAALWPFVLLFSSAFLLHRLTMLRPHVLTLGLSMLILALLVAGDRRAVFLAALATAWLHLSLFFVPLIILTVVGMIKIASEKYFAWREGAALLLGLVAGWLLRPNPLGAAQIAHVQLFRWTLEQLAGAPLEVGSELRPLTLALYSNYLPYILLASAALIYWFWQAIGRRVELSSRERTIGYAAAILSLGFFSLSLWLARRAFDFASTFAVIPLALVAYRLIRPSRWLRYGLFGLFVALALYGLSLRDRVLAIAWPADRFAIAARWLEANSQPGDIVFNPRWEYFSELFFWNVKNHYIGGMDPIFQYAFDPELYRLGLAIGAAQHSMLCPGGACPQPAVADRHRVLKENFQARYVFLLKQADASLFVQLLGDPRFVLRHQDEYAALFEVR